MINETDISNILNTTIKKKIFQKPIKNFIIDLYKKDLNIDTFIPSLYLLNIYKDNIKNLHLCIFTCIIIINKFNIDYNIPIKKLCKECSIKYTDFIIEESKILNFINWELYFYQSDNYNRFNNNIINNFISVY